MKLLYIFMTTVVVLFSGKCAFAESPDIHLNVNEQIKNQLWQEGIHIKKKSRSPIKIKKKIYPEELSKAIELESKKLYGDL